MYDLRGIAREIEVGRATIIADPKPGLSSEAGSTDNVTPMPNVVSRSDLRWLLDEWSQGRRTAAQIHDWAEARFAVPAWICEDDVANEVLAELDTLDMNLLTSEDIPVLYAMLELPRGQASLAHDLLKAHFAKVSLDARKKKLADDPPYAPFCRQ